MRSLPLKIKGYSADCGQRWAAFGAAALKILGWSTIQRGLVMYRIVNIGASFSNKDQKKLEDTINNYGEQGWRFHSVFSVESRGCLGLFRESTNFMVLEAAWARGQATVQPSGKSKS